MGGARGLLGLMFDALGDGVCVVDRAYRIVYANAAAARLLGAAREALFGASSCQTVCARLLKPDGSDSAASCPCRTSRGPSGQRGRLDGQTELRVRCEPLASPLLDELGPELRLLLLEEARDEADAERAREDWRHMLVHDMRSPLANVFGVLRLIEETHKDADPQEAELLNVSLRSCRRVLHLLDDYLDVARLEAGLMPVRTEAIELDALARRCVEEQLGSARERSVTVDTGGEEGVVAAGDPDLLARVAHNLLANAIKFSPRGGRVAIETARAGAALAELRVGDQGPGIGPEDQARLFERFFQGASGRAALTKGTGLGLAFCFQALRAMRGAISVSSKPGGGSTFVARLPASDHGSERQAAPAAPPARLGR